MRGIHSSFSIREVLAEGSAVLAAAGIENPGLDASLLLAEVLNTSRSSLIAAGSQPIADTSRAAFDNLIKRRLGGECVAYIVGRKEFYGLNFRVNPSVLVPRPDTELLVETAIKELGSEEWGVGSRCEQVATKKQLQRVLDCMRAQRSWARQIPYQNKYPARVLDLCTGSGAIAIALQHEMPELEVWATDISAEALEVAKANAARLVPTAAINFCQGNLYDALPSSFLTSHCSFPVIVSNPPYVPSAEIPGLSPEVRMEPILALDGGADGLDLIRRIISRAPEFLCPQGISQMPGVLLLEASPDQMQTITTLLQQAGFTGISTHRDLSGKERVIGGKLI